MSLTTKEQTANVIIIIAIIDASFSFAVMLVTRFIENPLLTGEAIVALVFAYGLLKEYLDE